MFSFAKPLCLEQIRWFDNRCPSSCRKHMLVCLGLRTQWLGRLSLGQRRWPGSDARRAGGGGGRALPQAGDAAQPCSAQVTRPGPPEAPSWSGTHMWKQWGFPEGGPTGALGPSLQFTFATSVSLACGHGERGRPCRAGLGRLQPGPGSSAVGPDGVETRFPGDQTRR